MAFKYKKGPRWYIGYRDAADKDRRVATEFTIDEPENEARVDGICRALERRLENSRRAAEKLPGRPTFAEYARTWIANRRAEGVASARDDESRLAKWLTPKLGHLYLDEIRPQHAREICRFLKSESGRAPATQRHIYFLAHAIFEEAVIDEVMPRSPWIVKKHLIPKKEDADAAWREAAVYDREEVIALATDVRIPEDRRVFYALIFVGGGMRFGEGSARRWNDIDRAAAPLWCMTVSTSYDTKRKSVKPPKGGRHRRVPIHPTLAGILDRWWGSGFQQVMGRPPTEDDLIVPSREGTFRSVNHMLRKLHEDMDRIGLSTRTSAKGRMRGQHDARATFVSLALADGANRDIIRWITHGATKSVFDGYTRMSKKGVWQGMCDEVAKLKLDLATPLARPPLPVVIECLPAVDRPRKNRPKSYRELPARDSVFVSVASEAGWTGLEDAASG